MSEHRRTYQLPHGIRVTFRLPLPSDGLLHCEWDPEMPQFRSNNAANKFRRAYTAARDDFLRELATMLGGSILNVDLDEHARLASMTEVRPRTVN